MKEEHKVFLTENCNRLTYGRCSNLNCLRRGGYKKGEGVNYDKATCIPYEIFQELSKEITNE